jgi:hypothetical protein
MAYSHDMLIDQATGELDWTFIKRHAVVRAERAYGSDGAPVSYVRDEIRYLKDIAGIMRKRWRDARYLPDDTKYVTITQQGRPVDGVRRSAF